MIEANLLEFANRLVTSKLAHRDLTDPIFVERLALACCAVAVADESERITTEIQELAALEHEFAK